MISLAMMLSMAAVQTPDEIHSVLARVHGQAISRLQVLGINSLKSIDPLPDALVGATIIGSNVFERTFCVITDAFEVNIDLQRTGKIVWLDSAEPYQQSAGAARPTVRLVLQGGNGIDLTEPAKTKRITVSLSRRSA